MKEKPVTIAHMRQCVASTLLPTTAIGGLLQKKTASEEIMKELLKRGGAEDGVD